MHLHPLLQALCAVPVSVQTFLPALAATTRLKGRWRRTRGVGEGVVEGE